MAGYGWQNRGGDPAFCVYIPLSAARRHDIPNKTLSLGLSTSPLPASLLSLPCAESGVELRELFKYECLTKLQIEIM